jgi:SAM-dependent methyltransferase
MQKEKTLQFWDDFYRTDEEAAKEWIVHPSDSLFRCILESLRHDEITDDPLADGRHDRLFMVLEIGCGTSLLSDALCQYWERQESCRKLNIIATDVSHVCIEQQRILQRERDQNRCFASTFLEYQTLNITEPHTEFTSKFDLILDKGCLDTCLFRSKNTETWIDLVLHHLHSWLKPGGVYTLLTPRSKIKHVRDYPGFDISRKVLSAVEFDLGDLEPRGGNKTKSDNSIQKVPCQYMYTCRRRNMDEKKEEARGIK